MVYGRFGTSYDLDAALRLDIEDMVQFLSPFDAPFLGTFNGLGNDTEVRSILPTGEVYERRYDWLEDELLTPRSTVGANYTAADGEIEVAAGEAYRFSVDDLIRVTATAGTYAQYLVTAVDTTTDILTVTLWSGTDANSAAGNDVIGIGTLPVEGSDPGETRKVDRTRPYNNTQIFGPYPIELSETEQNVLKYGVTSEWQHQVVKRVREAVVGQEQAILYGTRKDDGTERRRSMGGLDYWISAANGSTVDTTTTTLAGTGGEADLRTLQQNCYMKGGDPRLLVVGPANKPDISDWRKTDIRFQASERQRGAVVTSFETDFNIIDVLMHRWVLPSDAFLFSPDQAEVVTLRNRQLRWVNTAKTGDRDQSYLITEKGFKFRRAAHAGKMSGLTT
jgi:hypothetical protein